MSDQRDTPQSAAYLERVNSNLTRGLRRCHVLVDDYRAHLVPTNSNQPPLILAEAKGETDEDEPAED